MRCPVVGLRFMMLHVMCRRRRGRRGWEDGGMVGFG